MFKMPITYTSFDEEEITEDFYFSFTEAELIEMQSSEYGGLKELLERIVASKDSVKIMEWFRKIVLSAVGSKSADGKRFYKDESIIRDFKASPAYSIIVMKMFEEPEFAREFIYGCMPKAIRDKVPQ